jgi:hypothetical protein
VLGERLIALIGLEWYPDAEPDPEPEPGSRRELLELLAPEPVPE